MSFRDSGSRFTTIGTLVMIVSVMISILVGSGSVVLSQEVKTPKPKKPRFERNEFTLTDNVTQLTWTLSGYAAGQQFSWNGAFAYIDTLNSERYAGARNWRLPSKEELLTLVDYTKGQGFNGSVPGKSVAAGLSKLGFQQVQEGGYWSSTEYFYYEAEAWVVDMTTGSVSSGVKTLYYSIWPVHSAR
jgi:hypothetical protein